MGSMEQKQKVWDRKRDAALSNGLDTEPKLRRALELGLISGKEKGIRSNLIKEDDPELRKQYEKELEEYRAGKAATDLATDCSSCKVDAKSSLGNELLVETEQNLEKSLEDKKVDLFLEEEDVEIAKDNQLHALIEEENKDSIDKNKKSEMKELVEYSALINKLTNLSKGERLYIIKKVNPSRLSDDDKAFLLKNKSSIDRYQNKFDKLIKDIKEHIDHNPSHDPIKDLYDQLAKPPENLNFWQKRTRALGTATLKNLQGDGYSMVDFKDGQMTEVRANYKGELRFFGLRPLGRLAISLVFGKNWADSTLKEHYQSVADKARKHAEFSYASVGALHHDTIFGIGHGNEPMTLDEMTDADNLIDKDINRSKSKREKLSKKIDGMKKGVKEKVSGIFEYSPNESEPPRVSEHLDTHQVLSKLNLAHDPDLVTRLAAVFDPKNYSASEENDAGSNFTFGDVDPASINEEELHQSFDYSRVVSGYQKADARLEQILLKAPNFNRFDPDGKVWDDFVKKAGNKDGEARQMIRMVQENLRTAPKILEERAQKAREKWIKANNQLRKHFTESDFKTKNGEVANFTYLLAKFRGKNMIEVRVNVSNKDGVYHYERDHESGRVIGYIDYETGILYSPPTNQESGHSNEPTLPSREESQDQETQLAA